MFLLKDTSLETNSNEIVVDDPKLGSVINLNEKPYFILLNNEEPSSNLEVNKNPIEKNNQDDYEDYPSYYNDDLKIFNEVNDEKDTNEVKDEKDTNEVKDEKDTNEVKDEKDTNEVKDEKDTNEVKSEIDTNEISTQLSSETKEADSNLVDESNFLSLIIAIHNLPPIDENDDDEPMVSDLKAEQNEQQYELLTNEINMLSLRLSDMEKLLIQSFQLNLMIILMFILGTSLILFRAFFMNKRHHKIVFHASNRNGKVMNANGEKVPFKV